MPSNAWRTRSTSWRSAFSGTDASHELMIAGGVYTTAGGDSAGSARVGPDVECVHEDNTSHRQVAGGGGPHTLGRRRASRWSWRGDSMLDGGSVGVSEAASASRAPARAEWPSPDRARPCGHGPWFSVIAHLAGLGRLSRCGRPERRGHGARRRAVRERSGRYRMIRGTGHIYDIAKEGEVRCISHEISRRLECRCGSSGRTELQASEK
jgi:hypothetical protein